MSSDDAKALLLTYESRIERRHQANISPLSSVNLSVAPLITRSKNVESQLQND